MNLPAALARVQRVLVEVHRQEQGEEAVHVEPVKGFPLVEDLRVSVIEWKTPCAPCG